MCQYWEAENGQTMQDYDWSLIDPTQHSPVIGWSFDGYPIYGMYTWDENGAVQGMKSSYEVERTRQIFTITNGPNTGNQEVMDLGYFREDYEFISNSSSDYLDSHNGRFAVTPEYPEGTYAYYCTVDEAYNSAYPYAVGPKFYGVYTNSMVVNVNETTIVYTDADNVRDNPLSVVKINVYPNPAAELVAIQVNNSLQTNMTVSLLDVNGKLIDNTTIARGSTIAYFDLQKIYAGKYLVRVTNGDYAVTKELIIIKE